MKSFLAVIVAAIVGFGGQRPAWAQETSAIERPVRQQEIDRLKRQIDSETRSSVEAVTDYHTETGDLNSRLDFIRYGGRLNLKLDSSSVLQVTGTRTQYLPLSSAFREAGTNLTAGIQTKLSEETDVHLEAGGTRFSTGAMSINGLASLTYNLSDQTHLYATASRSNVEESLLSMTGIRPVAGPFAGQLVGRVMENRFVAGGSARLLERFDIFGEGGAGYRAGSNVPSNFFKTAGGGVGYSIIARPDDERLSLVRAAYEFSYFGFDADRSGFGGASLVNNRASNIASVGGYFSPQQFVSNVVRVEAKGGSDDRVSYRLAGFVGSQNYTGASGRLANGLSATASIALTERVSLPITYFIDNFGPFTQQSVYARLAVKF